MIDSEIIFLATEIAKIYTTELMSTRRCDAIRCTEFFLSALKYALDEIKKNPDFIYQLLSLEPINLNSEINTSSVANSGDNIDHKDNPELKNLALEITKTFIAESIKDKNYDIARCTEIFINTFKYALNEIQKDGKLMNILSSSPHHATASQTLYAQENIKTQLSRKKTKAEEQ